jgi:hypothetical protein
VSVIWMVAADYVRKFNYPALDETETAPYVCLVICHIIYLQV